MEEEASSAMERLAVAEGEMVAEPIVNNTDGDADSGVDESTQAKDGEGKKSRIPKKTPPGSPQKRSRPLNNLDHRRIPRSKSVPKVPFSTFSTPPSSSELVKKVPMNKIVVGNTPSPNLKKVTSKVGSMANANHKPGGGQFKLETKKLEWNATAKTNNINDKYVPGGGEKKIENRKLKWNAESKVKSLENATHKPGGGVKQIENRKLNWNKESKVGSTNNIKHRAGGGNVKIHDEKVTFEVGSRVGSLANVKHRPGGGEKKIFDDKEYIRQMSETASVSRSGPGSLNGSVIGSSSQLITESSLKRNPSTPDSTYQQQITRKMSPMSSGF